MIEWIGPHVTGDSLRVRPRILGLIAFLICFTAFIAYYEIKFGLNVPPSTSGDEVDYDSIAWELSKGERFQVDWQDAEFRAPYDRGARHAERFRLRSRPKQLITSRPPAFPFVVSYLNRLVGRQFWATRVLNATMMAATLALIVVTLVNDVGPSAAGLSVLLFVGLDVRTRLYGRAILTESMSLFVTSILCVVLIRWASSRRGRPQEFLKDTLLFGVLFGLSVLTRTLMVLWIPGLCVILYWISRRQMFTRGQALAAIASFLAGLVVVLTPWVIRNIDVTGRVMPLGTQGHVQLSAAFGDAVWESGGIWVNLDQRGFFDEVVDQEQSPMTRRLAKADWSRQQAFAWIQEHPWKSLVLVPFKIWQEWRPRRVTEAIILALTILGAWVLRKAFWSQVLVVILITNSVAIGLTWSVADGRFLVPVLFPIHLFAATGAAWLLEHFSNWFSGTRTSKQSETRRPSVHASAQ